MQNKCIKFCLNSTVYNGTKEFEEIDWLPVFGRFNHCICFNVLNFFNESCLLFLHDLYKPSAKAK